jgi:hypothetical protein
MHMGTTLQERGNQQAVYTTSAWHYHYQMVIVSDWWAAISQKAPSSDSGLEVLALAAGLLILAPQLDWPAPRKIESAIRR